MCPPRLPSSTAKLWERPTNHPPPQLPPLLPPTPPLPTQTQQGKEQSLLFVASHCPAGHFASLSLSFHLSEMRVFFFPAHLPRRMARG